MFLQLLRHFTGREILHHSANLASETQYEY